MNIFKGTSVSHGVLLLEPKNVGFPRLPDSASEEVALLEHHLLKLKARLNVS